MPRVAEAALPYATRPAVRFEQMELPQLTNQDLLALVIGGGYASATASTLLDHSGGDLMRLYTAPVAELVGPGVGQATARRLRAALELGRRLSARPSRFQITSPQDSFAYFDQAGLPLCDQEELWVAALDTKNRVLNLAKVYRGNVNSVTIRSGELLRDAIRVNATAIILAHNHPSGDPTPSPEDIGITRNIRQAAGLLQIDLLDHLIVAPGRYVSLKERGLGFQ